MSISTALAIAGIAATVVFGLYSIFLFFRTQNYPGRVTFVKDTCIGLFDSLARNLPELAILYRDKPVGEDLVLLKGFILNTGTKDILPEMVEDQISLNIPNNYRWLTAKIVSASPEVNAGAKVVTQQQIKLETGLFRRDEYIGFQALAEVPVRPEGRRRNPGRVLEGALNFRHRVADTRGIERQEIQTESQRHRNRRTFIASAIQIALLVFLLMSIVWTGTEVSELRYIFVPDGHEALEVRLLPRADGMVKISGVDTEFEDMMPVEELFSNYRLRPTIGRSGTAVPLLITCIILLLLSFGLLISAIRQRQKDARLRALLPLESHENPRISDDA